MWRQEAKLFLWKMPRQTANACVDSRVENEKKLLIFCAWVCPWICLKSEHRRNWVGIHTWVHVLRDCPTATHCVLTTCPEGTFPSGQFTEWYLVNNAHSAWAEVVYVPFTTNHFLFLARLIQPLFFSFPPLFSLNVQLIVCARVVFVYPSVLRFVQFLPICNTNTNYPKQWFYCSFFSVVRG